MKKSNYILFSLFALASAFLLFLWYRLGFNKVDNPLDLTISVVWWVVIAAFIFFVVRFEKKRRQQIRTVYVSPTALFNCESGLVPCASPERRTDMIENILANLKYGFDAEDLPEEGDFDFQYVVRTEDFKEENAKDRQQSAGSTSSAAARQSSQEDVTWKGSVVKIGRVKGQNEESAFDSRSSLAAALA